MAVKAAAAPKAAAPRIRRISHPSVDERLNQGRTARDRTPPSSHAGWSPATDRPDPVGLLEQQNRTREPDLVPVRHGRMMISPFTFYRGAAKIMAEDLKDTPTAGIVVQLCGDAHLSNFGAFASPGALPDRGHGPQGRRCRQCRHPGIHRLAAGTRRARSPVPAS